MAAPRENGNQREQIPKKMAENLKPIVIFFFFSLAPQFLRKSFLSPPFCAFYERFQSISFVNVSTLQSSRVESSYIFSANRLLHFAEHNGRMIIYISSFPPFFFCSVFKFTVKDKYQEIYLRCIILLGGALALFSTSYTGWFRSKLC